MALVLRGYITQSLWMATGETLGDFERGIAGYSLLISKVEVEFARRAIEVAFQNKGEKDEMAQ